MIDYSKIPGLSSEVKERLKNVRPASIVCHFRSVPNAHLSPFSLMFRQLAHCLFEGSGEKNGRYDAHFYCLSLTVCAREAWAVEGR